MTINSAAPDTVPAGPRAILITGASSGIGAALALAYAAPGVTLSLTGRDPIRLAGVANEARARGAEVTTGIVDASDQDGMGAFIAQRDAARGLDLVIANAGIAVPGGRLNDLDRLTRQVFATNIDGVLNTIHPAIAAMLPRGRGQIAIIGSLAGFRGLPSAPAYAASKAAVRSYGEGLRTPLARRGIRLSVVAPGFVRSGITARNRFPMPFLMDADRAAAIIMRGLAANRGRIAFPFPTYFGAWLLNTMPNWLAEKLTAGMPDKT